MTHADGPESSAPRHAVATAPVPTLPVEDVQLAMLRAVPHEERLARTLALSSFVRALTWAGAVRTAGHLGRDAVLRRFFLQYHGPDVPVPDELLRHDGDRPGDTDG